MTRARKEHIERAGNFVLTRLREQSPLSLSRLLSEGTEAEGALIELAVTQLEAQGIVTRRETGAEWQVFFNWKRRDAQPTYESMEAGR